MNDSGKDGRSPPQTPARRPATRVVTAGRDPASYHGFVNPPVYHASTVLYPSAEDFLAHRARYQYGRRGTPTTLRTSPARPTSPTTIRPGGRASPATELASASATARSTDGSVRRTPPTVAA